MVSDTHIPRRGKTLPRVLLEGIKGADLIIHAGDINKDYVIYELEDIAKVEYVMGNTDSEEDWVKIDRKKVIEVDDCKIGVIHGYGDKGTTLGRVRKAFEGEDLDCIVFGHSHIPMNEVIEGVLYFNPGSPTDKRRQKFFSYGMLSVSRGSVSGKIIYF
ncbi:MAG: YfcE family phosphodiesterase [Clostridia bacterium]|nr:YfcE family phosphodiesterase [Clostridia bacterium]